MEHVRGDASKEIVEGGRETPTEAVIKIDSIAYELDEMARSRSGESERWKAESIYRIPWNLRKLQEKAYQPQMVSIGPYHHGNSQLKEMEEHKKRALHTFLERSEKLLEDYVKALAPVMQDLKNAYPQLEAEFKKPAGNERFLTLMIIDGCFMLELMRTTGTLDEKEATGYAKNDPIFSKHGALYFRPLLKRDMLMVENQIPLLVLIKIVEAEVEEKVGEAPEELSNRISKVRDELSKRIFQFLERPNYGDGQLLKNCVHILDIYRKSLFLSEEKPAAWGMKDCFGLFKTRPSKQEKQISQGSPAGGENDCNIRSATELKEAWIRIERSASDRLDDISFSKGIRGVLRLPKITVDDTSEYLYLNLMAFERFHQDAGNDVTSYVFFMDRLIDSAGDVSLLHWHGVLENALGSDQDVANLFNSLSTDVCLDPASELFRVQMRVADQYRKPLPRIMAFGSHTYCTNPWITLSVAAAIFLFALTITQTLFAILDYKKK